MRLDHGREPRDLGHQEGLLLRQTLESQDVVEGHLARRAEGVVGRPVLVGGVALRPLLQQVVHELGEGRLAVSGPSALHGLLLDLAPEGSVELLFRGLDLVPVGGEEALEGVADDQEGRGSGVLQRRPEFVLRRAGVGLLPGQLDRGGARLLQLLLGEARHQEEVEEPRGGGGLEHVAPHEVEAAADEELLAVGGAGEVLRRQGPPASVLDLDPPRPQALLDGREVDGRVGQVLHLAGPLGRLRGILGHAEAPPEGLAVWDPLGLEPHHPFVTEAEK